MARITIEDTRVKIPNKFELVVLTSQRVRELTAGAKPTIISKNKEVVVALREIAEGRVSPELLKEALIVRHQNKRNVEQDDPYTNTGDHFSSEEAWKAFNETAAGVEQGVSIDADHISKDDADIEDDEADESDESGDIESIESDQMFADEEDVD